MSFMSLKTRSLFTIMALSLFAISFTMISDSQTAYGIEISEVKVVVNEDGTLGNDAFENIAIIDVKINENGIYLLYYDKDNDDFLKFIVSEDNGESWNEPIGIGGGLDNDFAQVISEHIFIRDNGDIGIGWEQERLPILVAFALSDDNGFNFDVDDDALESDISGDQVSWSGDGENIALTFSDPTGLAFQAVIVSNDFGASWDEFDPIILQNEDDDEVSSQSLGSIKVKGANMYVIWIGVDETTSDPTETHVYFSRSTNDGEDWDPPIQISDSIISEIAPQFLLNEDDTDEMLIGWIGLGGELMQAVSTNGGVDFDSPTELDDGDACQNEFDIDNFDGDVVFMCLGKTESERHVKLSNNFGQSYFLEHTISSEDAPTPFSSDSFPENTVLGNNFYSLWEDKDSPNSKFLSTSLDKGETFNFDSIPGLDGVPFDNGIHSRQAVFGQFWNWFVQTDDRTISFVQALASPTDHYLGYDAKVKHDDDDKEDKKGQGHDNHEDKENGKGHEKYDDDDDHEKIQVTLVDEFEGEVNYDVKKLEMLFNPLAKNDEGIQNDENHLVAYDIKKSKGEPKFKGIKNILVTNQFENITLDIKKAKMLLVPSNKTLDTVPTELEDILINHFKCYDSKVSKHTPEFERRTVDLNDQFVVDSFTMEVKKPKFLCSPVDKEGEGIVNEKNFLVCYDLKKIKGEPKFKKMNVFINNQFGSEELKVKKPNLLCVPSTIVEPPVCEGVQVLDTETNTCVAPESGLCGEGTTLIDGVCTIDETKRVHKHIHKHINKHVHSYDSSYSEHEQDSDSSYSEHEQDSDSSYSDDSSEHEQDSEQEPESFSGSFIGKHKDNGTWKTTGAYTIDDDKFRKVTTTGPFSIETIEECKQISASGTIEFRNGDVNADFDLQKCDNSPKYTGTFVITGGTGEYEGATGSGDVTIQGGMKHFKGYLNGEISIPT